MAVDNDGTVFDFLGNSDSFKFKQKIICKTGDDGRKTAEIWFY